MYCPNCGAEFNDMTNFCPECGTDVRDRTGGGAGGSGRAAVKSAVKAGDVDGEPTDGDTRDAVTPTPSRVPAESTTTVPDDAAAIDITCPHCGKRPIEEMANGHRINGLVAVYTRSTYRVVACHKCLRRKLWWMAAKNLVLGWWGIKAAFWNLVLTSKNIARGAINRGPNANLVRSLEDVGVIYDYLEDPDAFDPSQHSPMELHIRSFVRLGAAIMLADGEAHPEEREAISDAVTQLISGYPEDKLDELIDRACRSPVDISRVAEGTGALLGPEGKQQAVKFVTSVAEAGTTTDHDLEMVALIFRDLDVDKEDVEAALGEEAPPVVPPGS